MQNYNLKPTTIPIKTSVDVIIARRRGLNMALEMGFPQPEATKIAVVISELTRNIILYTPGGSVDLIAHMGGSDKYFELVARDSGPGIANLDRVLQGGYSTSKGLGKGISGSNNLMDSFDVNSTTGKGTVIRATKRLR